MNDYGLHVAAPRRSGFLTVLRKPIKKKRLSQCMRMYIHKLIYLIV